jgi:hypothetical protein
MINGLAIMEKKDAPVDDKEILYSAQKRTL